MTPVGGADRGDGGGVTRCREPVVDRGADLAALDRRFARSVVTGDQKDDALASGNGALEPAVDRRPRAVEGEAVKVEDAVGLNDAGVKATVPA